MRCLALAGHEEPHWLSQIELTESYGGGAATDEPAAARLVQSASLYDIQLDVAASVASISGAAAQPADAAQSLPEAPAE